MSARSWLVFGIAVGLTACRFGFDELEDDLEDPPTDEQPPMQPPVPGTARVQVLGENGENAAGEAINGAYVVVIEGDGSSTTYTTAGDGSVRVDVLGNSAIHIARAAPDLGSWLVYSFAEINDGGEIVVGGRPPIADLTVPRTMTVDLPVFPDLAFTESRIVGPIRCVPDGATVTGTSVSFSFDPACEGETVQLLAQGLDPIPEIYLSLGAITLADGATLDATSEVWLGAAKVAVDYTDLAEDVAAVQAMLALPTGADDMIQVATNGDTPMDGVAQVVLDIPPVVPGAVLTSLFFIGSGARLTMEPIDDWNGNKIFDNQLLTPGIALPDLDPVARRLTWTNEVANADLFAMFNEIDHQGTKIQWTAYGPATRMSAAYPALPASLAQIIPSATAVWAQPELLLIGLSDLSYATANNIIDRDMEFWLMGGGMYLPTGTFSISVALPAPAP